MKLKQDLCTVCIVLLMGCGGAQFEKFERKPTQNIEDVVISGLKDHAKKAPQCREQMTTLIENNERHMKNFSAYVRNLTSEDTASISVPSENPFKEIYEKIIDPKFQETVIGISEFIKEIAENEDILTHLKNIHGEVLLESGDRIAEILIFAVENSYAGILALEEAKRQLDCATFDSANWLQASFNLLSEIKAEILGNVGYLFGNTTLLKDAITLKSAFKNIPIPEKIQGFFPALSAETTIREFVCDTKNLDAYQNHIKFFASLLAKDSSKPDAPRPLRALLNMSLQLFTMNDTNQCTGTSFDGLRKEDLKATLSMIANFLADKKIGVQGIINMMKPRS